LQEFAPNTLSKQDKNEISIYKSGSISPEILGSGIKMITQAFPKLPTGWYSVLKEMLKDEGFNDNRFSDAVRSLIKNCPYPEPTIANVISYDKTLKVYTYTELLEHSKDYSVPARIEYLKSYGKIDFYGELRYTRNEDIQRYNLTTKEK
jgi:hypothetical protein